MLATKALTTCATPGCHVLVASGHCPAHTKARDRFRRDRRTINYAATWWLIFRDQFRQQLLALDILPVCGATLPGGPSAHMSACKAEKRQTLRSADRTDLHFHHEPELTPEEAMDRQKVCDPMRIVLLCRSCHSQATMKGRSFA